MASPFDIGNFNPLGTQTSTPAVNSGPNFAQFLGIGANSTFGGGQAFPAATPQVISPAPISPLTQKPVAFASTPQATPAIPSPAVNPNYQLQPGETADAYNRRVTAYRDSGGASTTSSGGYVATDGSGNATANPKFSIDTSGAIPSSVFGSSYSANDVSSTHKTYADYVNGLAQAQQYSPGYIAALQGVQANKLQGAALTSDFYTGNNLPGDTVGYAQGLTTKEQALNDIKGLGAQQALDVQTLLRNGNIAAAQALVQGNAPQSVSPGSSLVTPTTGDQVYSGLGGYQAVQAIQTVNNLAQTYPDAGIQPTDTLQTAQQKAAQAPSFASRQLVQVTLPGGGIEFVNKNQMQTNPDGSFSVVSSGQATTQSAASTAIKQLTQQKADTVAAIATADQNFPLLLSAAKAAGVNNNAPLFNQLQQAFARKAINSASLAALNTLIPSIQTEYSRIIARGGTVDDNTRKNAASIVDGTYSLKQLQAVYNTLKAESANVIGGYDTSINQLQGQLGGGSTGTGKYAF